MNTINQSLNRYLLLFIAASCTAFLLIWLLFNWLIIPHVTVIIDRSYCQSQQWQERVVKNYTQLYEQHPKRLKITQVVMFSDLGVEEFEKIPQPVQIKTLATFGQHNRKLRQQLETNNSSVRVLSCY